MSFIPTIVSSHMPTVSTLAQFAESHIPLPMLTLYAALTIMESAIPPAAGFCAIGWITIYQIMSALNLTKNPPLSPIPFIRGCVSSFIGLYLLTFLVMIPIRTNQITNYLASPKATAEIGNSFTRDTLKRFKNSMLNNEPDSTQKRPEHTPDAANPEKKK